MRQRLDMSDAVEFNVERKPIEKPKSKDSVRIRLTLNGKSVTITARKGIEESISFDNNSVGVKFLR